MTLEVKEAWMKGKVAKGQLLQNEMDLDYACNKIIIVY